MHQKYLPEVKFHKNKELIAEMISLPLARIMHVKGILISVSVKTTAP